MECLKVLEAKLLQHLAMPTVQKLPVSNLSMANGYRACKEDIATPDQFPAGLRVLVVDDDATCLRILEQMLRKCLYRVTTCCRATIALSLLREGNGFFDVVISDVHMPDMDGFKLLEHVGLEMDLPVIMMSADGSTSAVMRGIKHGACDYLIKPIRIEELKNIWQHVLRKKWNENKELENSCSVEDTERHRQVGDDADYASSVNEVTEGSWKVQKKRKDTKEDEHEDDGELDTDDPSTSKKPRVVWSVELHQQFVNAVNQLGIDKAVPKRILEMMNVPGLTRENVASHLQKFRLYLKRLSGVTQHQGGIPNSFCGVAEQNGKLGSLGRLDIQALAASGQIPPQTLAALQAELLGRPTSNIVLPGMDQPGLLQASLQGAKCIPVERGVTFGQPLIKCQSNVSRQFPQLTMLAEDVSSGFVTWPPNHFGAVVSTGNIGGLNTQSNKMLAQALKQPLLLQQQLPPVLPESSHTINVPPSCLVVPSHSSHGSQSGSNPMPITQNSGFINNSTAVEYTTLTSQSSNASLGGIGQVLDGDLKNAGVLHGYSIRDISVLPLVPSSSVRDESNTGWQVQNSTMNVNHASRLSGPIPTACNIPSSYDTKTGLLPDQGRGRSLGFVGKGMSIPSRFAVDDVDLASGDLSHSKVGAGSDGDRVKQELNVDFMEKEKMSISVLQFSPSDVMSVLSK